MYDKFFINIYKMSDYESEESDDKDEFPDYGTFEKAISTSNDSERLKYIESIGMKDKYNEIRNFVYYNDITSTLVHYLSQSEDIRINERETDDDLDDEADMLYGKANSLKNAYSSRAYYIMQQAHNGNKKNATKIKKLDQQIVAEKPEVDRLAVNYKSHFPDRYTGPSRKRAYSEKCASCGKFKLPDP